MMYSVFILALLVASGASQGIINGDPYFCVPSGICPMVNGGGGIDPRIITPDGGNPGPTSSPGPICPSGRYVCYAQGSNSNCGRRLVQITNTRDGEADPGAYPWQAFMTDSSGNYIGSGSLLSPYHVLTAAHKVLAFVSNPNQLTIIMGVNDPRNINNNPAAPRSTAAKITIYNPYSNETLKNDLAIVRLANPISLLNQQSINTICLPGSNTNANTYANPSQDCIVSGWGQAQPTNSPVPTNLKQVTVGTTDINTCERGFSRFSRVDTSTYLDKTGGQICAGGEPQRDACFQDGGAPLTCGTATSRFTVAGIVIWGKSCGQAGIYGVYTNVPYYREWIIRNIIDPIP